MSCTTVFDLNEDCWIELMDYLDVEDQVRLSSLHVCIGEMVKIYASHRYKNIDASLTGRIGDEYLKQLLRIVGEHLVSYESEWDYSSNGDQHLGVLRSHCTNLTQLKMSFRPGRRGWDDLYKLKKLKSLNAYLDMEDSLCTDFVYNLKQFTFLRKLKLNATSYGGRGLHVLDQLESLDVSSCGGFDSMSLVDCCQTMKQLRYLKFGGIRNIRKNSFKSLVTSWKQLECLSFLVDVVDSKFPYELVCQLPKLQHLQVTHIIFIHDKFIEGLVNKQGSPLESVILEGWPDRLFKDQVQHLCNISTLKELEVSCDTLPLKDLLNLKNLLYLHIYMPITNDQLLDLLKGLPRLKVLNLQDNAQLIIDNSFVNSVRTCLTEQRQQRGKITIYLGYFRATIDDIFYSSPLFEINKGSIHPILINKELAERD